ncbi:MAG: enoyl-CoA hydratase/isomerase [Lysobacteraceae bacterium]|nr:MAG: enoyl-CoA hydratase/isomerase [Xanthomonadaceae bacterium]
MTYQSIEVQFQDTVCGIRIARPQAGNAIDDRLIEEFHRALATCETTANVVIISGSPEVFCVGADFQAVAGSVGGKGGVDPGPLYDVWLRMATGPYVTISHVRGKANAGGIGFVAASDIVIADEDAQFSLSELLFGLFPACVMPFLVRRVGHQAAHYLTLTTQPINARRAFEIGLVDAVEPQSDALLKRHVQRLRRLSKTAIQRYKSYMGELGGQLGGLKRPAVAANLEMFSDPVNLKGIVDYVERGIFPWEKN